MPLKVYQCNEPTKPLVDYCQTVNYGIPKGIDGRNGQSIKGIVIHCIPNAINFFDTNINRDWRLGDNVTPKTTSVHYAIGQSGTIRQYVCDADIAWGFIPQLSAVCPPTDCTLNWSLVTANPNVQADEYLLHIALESPLKPKGSRNIIANDSCGCTGATVLDEQAYLRLVNLLAWLSDEYGIPLTTDFVQFAQNIEVCPTDGCKPIEKECECADIDALLCSVRDYCERCKSPKDNRFADGNIIKLYGENASECLTGQSVFSMLNARLRLSGGQLGLIDDEGVWHPIQSI